MEIILLPDSMLRLTQSTQSSRQRLILIQRTQSVSSPWQARGKCSFHIINIYPFIKYLFSPEVLVTHSKDVGQMIQAIHACSPKIGGTADIPTAVSIAQLALKHRQNKNLHQRVMIFVASPLEGQAANEAAMVRLTKKLKKNNVAVDVVAFGDGIEQGDHSVLRTFVETTSSGDNSSVLICPVFFIILTVCNSQTFTHRSTRSTSAFGCSTVISHSCRRPRNSGGGHGRCSLCF